MKMEEAEIEVSGLKKDLQKQELITSKKIAEAEKATNEFLEILTDDLNNYNPDDEDDGEINVGKTLTFLVKFVADAIKDEEVSLPAVQEGERKEDEEMGEYLYQNEYNALSENVQKKFDDIGSWITVTNAAVEDE